MTQLSAAVRPARGKLTDDKAAEAPTPPTIVPFFQRDTVRMAGVAFQFGLMVYILRLFAFEGPLLADVATFAWVGFIIHHLLPMRWRLPFFAALSVASVLVAVGLHFGWVVVAAGFGIIALCHARIPFKLRIVLLAVLGVPLLTLRTTPYSTPVVILASFFMLRAILYMYDLSNRAAAFSAARAALSNHGQGARN